MGVGAVIWDGFNGPEGVSKDEALEDAAELVSYAETLRSWIASLLARMEGLADG